MNIYRVISLKKQSFKHSFILHVLFLNVKKYEHIQFHSSSLIFFQQVSTNFYFPIKISNQNPRISITHHHTIKDQQIILKKKRKKKERIKKKTHNCYYPILPSVSSETNPKRISSSPFFIPIIEQLDGRGNVTFRGVVLARFEIKCIGNYVYPRVFVQVKYFLSFHEIRCVLARVLPRGSESFAKTFPLINLVYRWAGSGDACTWTRQNLKYEPG